MTILHVKIIIYCNMHENLTLHASRKWNWKSENIFREKLSLARKVLSTCVGLGFKDYTP